MYYSNLVPRAFCFPLSENCEGEAKCIFAEGEEKCPGYEVGIIHYDFLLTSDKMTRLSEVSFKTLTECKKMRESLCGENHHEDQCKGIPAVLNEEPFYYHRECYQKFTYARALLKRKLENENETTKSNKRPSRASFSTGAACGIFPKQCMICSKERIKVGGKFQFPTKILTKA